MSRRGARGFSRASNTASAISARQTFMIVLRAEALEELDRVGPRLHALHGTVRHVDRRLSFAIDGFRVGALRDEIADHFGVAARRGVMNGGVALVIARVDVGSELLDE